MTLNPKSLDFIGVIGFGSWGRAIALLSSYNASSIIVYDNRQEKIDELKSIYCHGADFDMITNLKFTSDMNDLKICDAFIIAVPAQSMRSALNDIAPILINNRSAIIIIGAKGIENTSDQFMTQVIEDIGLQNSSVVISGPNFANDILNNMQSATTIGSIDSRALDSIKKLFLSEKFHVEITNDVMGLQICGALKNVYAIGSGMMHTFPVGENIRAAFFKKIVCELRVILQMIGGQESTIFSYGGIGDLLLTCNSHTSRNFTFGQYIVQHHDIDTRGYTVEGYYTLLSIKRILGLSNDIKELSILNMLYDMIYNKKPIILDAFSKIF